MKRMMLIGETGSGKSSLIRALSDGSFHSSRAMAVEFHGPFIITPGEFLENRRFYRALITASMDCDVLAMLQNATRNSSVYPPLFARTFNRTVIGLITHADEPSANTQRAEKFLRNAGIDTIVPVYLSTGEGLDVLRALLYN